MLKSNSKKSSVSKGSRDDFAKYLGDGSKKSSVSKGSRDDFVEYLDYGSEKSSVSKGSRDDFAKYLAKKSSTKVTARWEGTLFKDYLNNPVKSEPEKSPVEEECAESEKTISF